MLSKALLGFSVPDNQPSMTAHYNPNPNPNPNPNTKTVRYGVRGTYSEQTHTDSVVCTNGVFGDPIDGVVKTCQVEVQTQQGACKENILIMRVSLQEMNQRVSRTYTVSLL